MIDFKEFPKDGIKFEQLVRELLVLRGFETQWTGVGADGGRDLAVTEKLRREYLNKKENG
jgi:HJR/Mrr/RecB family endonuclease